MHLDCVALSVLGGERLYGSLLSSARRDLTTGTWQRFKIRKRGATTELATCNILAIIALCQIGTPGAEAAAARHNEHRRACLSGAGSA